MMEHNFVSYFNQFTKLLQHFLVLKTQSQNGNLRDCQSTVLFTPNNVVSLFVAYELDRWSQYLKDCLLRAVIITKNADLDKYIYTSYGIRFNSRSEFSLTDGSIYKNVISFGVYMSSSMHIDNKKRYFNSWKDPTQGLDR